MKTRIFLLITMLTFVKVNIGQDCSSIVSTVNNGNIQIVIFSENGECFKAKLLNQYLFPGFSNQITFLESDGLKKMKIELETGEIIEKTIAINAEYKKAMFQIKKNKKGIYALKVMPFQTTTNGPSANELMIQAKKNLEEFNAKIEREEQERIKAREEKKRKEAAEKAQKEKEEKERLVEEKNASVKSSNNSSSSTASSGSTKVTLLIVYGEPAGIDIEIGYKGNIIGNGTTDKNGRVTIYTNSLISKNIDVYGENNGNTWSIEGLTKLDDNNYAEVDPTKAIQEMLEKFEKIYNIDDHSEEEIMEEFGF